MDALQGIYEQLEVVASFITQQNYFANLIPWGLGIISSSIGAIIGYIILSKQDKKKFIRESHIEYMKLTNKFLWEINKIITSMVNIQKMGFILVGDSNNPNLYEPYFYGNLNDYLFVVNKIRNLRKFVENISPSSGYTSVEHYKEQIILLSDDILNFNKLVSIGSDYEREAANYYYFINENLLKEHALIINELSNATKKNMNGFDIEVFKKRVLLQIKKTNELILGNKLEEQNLFNQIEENSPDGNKIQV